MYPGRDGTTLKHLFFSPYPCCGALNACRVLGNRNSLWSSASRAALVSITNNKQRRELADLQ